MAVVYMKKLENEPTTYDLKFTKLTNGVNIKIQNWILKHIKPKQKILEIGPGPGKLSKLMSQKGTQVVAVDNNPNMVQTANKIKEQNSSLNLTFIHGNALELEKIFVESDQSAEKFDIIVSTFMLSELRPYEHQIFLRSCWKLLKSGGSLLLAGEFIPKGLNIITFKIKRWWYKLKMHRMNLITYPLKWFTEYFNPIGFRFIDEKKWKGGSIKALHYVKKDSEQQKEPGFYYPPHRSFTGIHAILRVLLSFITDKPDIVAIQPGIYKSGIPNAESPILVSANYDLTYIKLMKRIQGIDAWVILVDSRGINVWCAARGDDFGNNQLIEAVKATEIKDLSSKKTLILPQLSAGGVSIPNLPKKSPEFPFNVKFGPVWAKDIPEYLKDPHKKKTNESMKRAKFTLRHRFPVGVSHSIFLIKKIFLLPLIIALIFMMVIEPIRNYGILLYVFFNVLFINNIISIFYPLSRFTRRFIIKGIFFGIFNVIFYGLLIALIESSFNIILWNSMIFFWVSFFSTMSFSGSTFDTSPTEIGEEYPFFKKISNILLMSGLILSLCGLIVL